MATHSHTCGVLPVTSHLSLTPRPLPFPSFPPRTCDDFVWRSVPKDIRTTSHAIQILKAAATLRIRPLSSLGLLRESSQGYPNVTLEVLEPVTVHQGKPIVSDDGVADPAVACADARARVRYVRLRMPTEAGGKWMCANPPWEGSLAGVLKTVLRPFTITHLLKPPPGSVAVAYHE